jgi:hypothetical protein
MGDVFSPLDQWANEMLAKSTDPDAFVEMYMTREEKVGLRTKKSMKGDK